MVGFADNGMRRPPAPHATGFRTASSHVPTASANLQRRLCAGASGSPSLHIRLAKNPQRPEGARLAQMQLSLFPRAQHHTAHLSISGMPAASG